jgi:hypothetical protein
MTYLHTLVVEDRRLAMLSLLADSAGYSAGSPMLQLALGGMGHNIALDTVNSELAWLRDTGLVTLENVGGVIIAGVNGRGVDVARGRTTVPGVARPRPE